MAKIVRPYQDEGNPEHPETKRTQSNFDPVELTNQNSKVKITRAREKERSINDRENRCEGKITWRI